jgi:hypothetical protein
MIAGVFMDNRDVPWLLHPFLIAFGAALPMLVIAGLATAAVNWMSVRRERLQRRPRPRLAYLCLALGGALAAAAFRLLGGAAGGGPDGTGDWVVTGLGWSFMISVCTALLMITRAITIRTGTYRGAG